MPLIRSISGIRGTIGGGPEEGLSPQEVVSAVSAFASILQEKQLDKDRRVVIGRDARSSGSMVRNLTVGTLQACGYDVTDLGISTTPTVEMLVPQENALGGIVLTASHNPMEWNALKFLDEKGEFISSSTGEELIQRAGAGTFSYVTQDRLGKLREADGSGYHIDRILELGMVKPETVRERGFKVVVDAVNSSGGIYIPRLLEALGVQDPLLLHCDTSGQFAHDPEPLPEHLRELSDKVRSEEADLGIVVDPDVDRLAFIDENGEAFGEEYTLVAVADHVLRHKLGATVSNLSSSRALKDVTEKRGAVHYASAVGEVNVVEKMKEVNAVIGGEGNGGVILPDLHYGRDALLGIALFLTHLAEAGSTCSQLRGHYPDYYMAKEKLRSKKGDDVDALLERITSAYSGYPIDRADGVKIDFDREWVHLRRSNTEPIVRIYTESISPERAQDLADRFVKELGEALEDLRSTEKRSA
ncbi:MAG: phosphoglucosamine mutase [Flavobacteriales bacterium]